MKKRQDSQGKKDIVTVDNFLVDIMKLIPASSAPKNKMN